MYVKYTGVSPSADYALNFAPLAATVNLRWRYLDESPTRLRIVCLPR